MVEVQASDELAECQNVDLLKSRDIDANEFFDSLCSAYYVWAVSWKSPCVCATGVDVEAFIICTTHQRPSLLLFDFTHG